MNFIFVNVFIFINNTFLNKFRYLDLHKII